MNELLNGSQHLSAHEHLAALSSTGISLPTAFYEGRATVSEVRSLLEHYRHAPPKHVRIDCNWKLTWILPVFLETFPNARVVHLVRDPRDAIRSCLALDFYGKLREREDFRGDSLRNYWLSQMPAIRRDDWDALDQLGKNCAFWLESQRLARAALETHPMSLVVRLEDLLADDRAVWGLFEFFDVPRRPIEEVRALRAVKLNDRAKMKERLAKHRPAASDFERWPAVERARLIEMCGPMASLLGYDLAGSRAE